MLFKLGLIVFYWLIIFVCTRLFEIFGLIDHGLGCSVRHNNISSLDMNTLKLILDQRGVSYTKVVNKIDIFSLLSASGESLLYAMYIDEGGIRLCKQGKGLLFINCISIS